MERLAREASGEANHSKLAQKGETKKMSGLTARRWMIRFVVLACVVAFVADTGQAQKMPRYGKGKERVYYVAADEVEWNYAPSGMDQMMGMPFEGMAKAYTERAKHRIGTVYRKAIFREYTDGTFTKLKPRQPEWEHLGILGPVLRAEVGDTIKVVFKNNGSRPYSMHPHGVYYLKASEGSSYNDGSTAADKAGGGGPARPDLYLYLARPGTRRARTQGP